MIKLFRGCLSTLVTLGVLVAVAYAGWVWGPSVFPRLGAWLGVDSATVAEGPQPTPEMGEAALGRIQDFRRGEGPSELALEPLEVESLLRFSLPAMLPDGVAPPRVLLADSRLTLRSRVVPDDIGGLPDLGGVLGVLPDTVPVEISGTLIPFEGGGSALLFNRVQAMGVPLPRRAIPDLLTALGRTSRPGLPAEAMLVPLPAGVRSAWVERDRLVLARNP